MLKFLIVFFPSSLKVFFLRAMGAKIGKNCYIGFSVIDAKHLEIGDYVRVGHFNLLWRLRNLKMLAGSRINMCNWITGAKEGDFFLGRNSAVTRFHFFEASSDIIVGHNTIIAGRNSHFFTHGISSTDLDDRRSITIGDWCYIGSSSRFIPGSGTSSGTFVGMGSVVTKHFSDSYVLVAGAPATLKKALSENDAYFNRSHLPHSHHPVSYQGF
jgi:acetyltransferase-like isoleucine patch superfamily enzyme